MEAKKLNFETPLLSARRFTSGTGPEKGSKWKIEESVRSVRRPPSYKSELKSGPVSNPGTVPFEWEQIPGRPKDDEPRLELHVAESYKVPKVPPGRTLVGQQDFDKAFVNPVVHNDQLRSISHESWNIQSSDENVKQSGSSKDGKEEVENCSSGYEDEEFLDALETLSRADSLLTNYSLGGFSGLENQDMQVSGTSPIDSQTRDFMLGRFLPAAQAMASETPQHPPRKPPVVHQQPRQLYKMVNEDKRPQLRYGPDFALEYSQRNGDGDEESDAGHDDEKLHGKTCGLLPGLGLRSSFFLMNPLPGLNMRSCSPMPLRKSHIKTSCKEVYNKHYLLDTGKQIPSVGLETSKQQANKKALENNDIPVHNISLDKPDLPSFRELLAEENKSEISGVGNQVAEKTVYVDTEHEVRSPQQHVNYCASDANGETEQQVKSHEIVTGKGAKSNPEFQIPEFHIVSSGGGADQQTRIAMQKPSIPEQDIFEGSKMPEEKFTKMRTKAPRNPEESKVYSEYLAPPPLIKSPSDSWLGRTLPSINTKKSSIHSYRGTWMAPKDQASKVKSSDPKWETIVRMTKMKDKHLCFSEDRLTPIPEA